MTRAGPTSTEPIRRQITVLLVAMINGLILYGALAVWFGPRIRNGTALIELAPAWVLGES